MRKATVKDLKGFIKGLKIFHDRTSKISKEDMIELIEGSLAIHERGTRIKRTDFSKAIKSSKSVFIDEETANKKADRDGLAYCHGWSSRYDSWYITYSYVVGKYEYAFAWETYYDEIHRGYSGETVWYDKLGQGTCFTIKYYGKDPKVHYTTAREFKKLIMPFFVAKRKTKK